MKRILICISGFVLIALFFTSPLFSNISYWGTMDWDQFTFWNAVPAQTILHYHQFPLWNPYTNGGNPLLAHPHTSFLSPFYLSVLILGPVIGLKLQICAHVILGLIGMFLLGRLLGMGIAAACVTAFVYMLSSFYPLRLSEGQTEWLTMAYVPWLFYFLTGAREKRVHLAGGVAALSAVILGGGPHIFTITAPLFFLFAVCQSVKEKTAFFLAGAMFIMAFTFALCAVKVLPVIEFWFSSPRLTGDVSGMTLQTAAVSVLDRNQAALYASTSQRLPISPSLRLADGWHEYGAYMGLVPLLLSCFGAVSRFRAVWPMVVAALAAFLMSVSGNLLTLDTWNILHRLPIFNGLSTPSRFIAGFIFFCALLAGTGFSVIQGFLRRQNALRRVWIYAVPFFVLVDLLMVGVPVFRSARFLPPLRVEMHKDFTQRYRFFNIFGDLSRSSLYPAFLSNSGVLEGYDIIHVPQGNVRIVSDPAYKGEVFFCLGTGEVQRISFSPNRVTAFVRAETEGTVVLNQNYDPGWKVHVDGRKQNTGVYEGLPALKVTPGEHKVGFYYLPESFITGAIISSVSVLCALYLGFGMFIRKRATSRKT